MRVERDFQCARGHLEPVAAQRFRLPELDTLVARLAALPDEERRRELALLGAGSVAELRARLEPRLTTTPGATGAVRVMQTSFDGRNHLVLELAVDSRRASIRAVGSTVAVASRSAAPAELIVRVATDAASLTPLARAEIFDPGFLAFADSAARSDPRVERQLRAVELLSSREKLMAGLPNFATYFGRDQMMTALMMAPIWTPSMAEHVIASVLRKLAPNGEVSHEEALGGQAIREGAAEYGRMLDRYRELARVGDRRRADSVLATARAVLADLQRVRENYHMIDDEFQLPVLVGRYLRDTRLDAGQKRQFLTEVERGGGSGASRLTLLARELEVVATKAEPYVIEPVATNLVGFARRDSARWESESWRDSGAGYANGRFAMDINAVWVPAALEALGSIMVELRTLGLARDDSLVGAQAGPLLRRYLKDASALDRARAGWAGAARHFIVRLSASVVRDSVRSKLAGLPMTERRHWERVVAATRADVDSIRFLALSLDAAGRPIPVANTDPATGLFLLDLTSRNRVVDSAGAAALLDVDVFTRPYPVGLFVDGLGPLVANDAYASWAVREAFERDRYHSPRVVWGREVNLLLFGIANQLTAITDDSGRARDPALAPYVRSLTDALRHNQQAVDASGLRHNELWSYQITDDTLRPIRYGTSSDVQLWNTTSLAVQYMLSRLPRTGGK